MKKYIRIFEEVEEKNDGGFQQLPSSDSKSSQQDSLSDKKEEEKKKSTKKTTTSSSKPKTVSKKEEKDSPKDKNQDKPQRKSSKSPATKGTSKKPSPSKAKKKIETPEQKERRDEKNYIKRWKRAQAKTESLADKFRDVLFEYKQQGDIAPIVASKGVHKSLVSSNGFSLIIKKIDVSEKNLSIDFVLGGSTLSNVHILDDVSSRMKLVLSIQEMSKTIIPNFIKNEILPKLQSLGPIKMLDKKEENYYVYDPQKERNLKRAYDAERIAAMKENRPVNFRGTFFGQRVNHYEGHSKLTYKELMRKEGRVDTVYDHNNEIGITDTAINKSLYSHGPISLKYFFKFGYSASRN